MALSLTVLVLLIFLAGESAAELLRYDRTAIVNGELWRLVTAHLVHLGGAHLLLNVAGLLLIGFLFADAWPASAWIIAFAIASATVSAGLWWGEPQLTWYVGLSGVLHGLLLFGALGLGRQDAPLGPLLVSGLIGKLVWEQWFGASPGTAELVGGAVIVNAHLYGAIGGLFAFGLLRSYRGFKRRSVT